MKKVALNTIKDELPKYLRLATEEDVLITRRGKPAARSRTLHARQITPDV